MRRFLQALLVGALLFPALFQADGPAHPPPAGEEAPEPRPPDGSRAADQELEFYQRELVKLRARQTTEAVADGEELGQQVALQRQQMEVLEKMIRLLALTPQAGEGARQPGPPDERPTTTEQELEFYQRELAKLRAEQATAQAPTDAERLRKHVDLQQKQIETLEKMIRLLAEQVRKAPPAGAAVEKLQTQAALLEARSQQAARRDQELAGAVDDLRETADARQRQGPPLPATLRELFLPSRPNESPLVFYGTLVSNFNAFEDTVSNFPAPAFSPHFYLLLNEHFLLEANPEFSAQGVELESAQVDWFLTDNLTLVAGRFYSPLGFFNERLHTSWIYKTPDRPLMFSQVYPASLSFNGLMLKGMTYLADGPVKLEGAALVTNGFSLAAANPTARDFADLRAMSDAFNDVNGDKAYGGRIGLVFPTAGVWVGLSGLVNGAYDRAGQHDLALWDVDFGWRRGNWDFRFEFARVHQQAPGAPIHRQGLYAQVAYRPFDSGSPFVRKLEGVVRYDLVQFRGINLAATGLNFGPRENTPIDRARYTVGLNYYLYESLIFKIAYEINEELRFQSLRDNGFLAQLTWGF
jgi:hypothetical protein